MFKASASRTIAWTALSLRAFRCVLAIGMIALAVRSFWRWDEAGYYYYRAVPTQPGNDVRWLVGSHRGGIVFMHMDAELYRDPEWAGGPRREVIAKSGAQSVLVVPTTETMPGQPFDPSGRWPWLGFNGCRITGFERDVPMLEVLVGHASEIPFHIVGVNRPVRYLSLNGKKGEWSAVVLPDWLIIILLMWAPALDFRLRIVEASRRRRGRCISCGYDLRASAGRCPECGMEGRGSTRGAADAVKVLPAACFIVVMMVSVSIALGLIHDRLRRQPAARKIERGAPLTANGASAAPERIDVEIAPGVSARFARIPAGHFIMGLHAGDSWEHEVIISRPFYMGVTGVTQRQYEAVTGRNPDTPAFRGPGMAVGNVSWNESCDFCRAVSKYTGRKVHLPTEAQWEYACRAGTTTRFNTGNTLSRDDANIESRDWYPANRVWTTVKADPVASFPPNAWGLFDMHGNASEWCADWEGPYPTGPVTDPVGPETGEWRIRRNCPWTRDCDSMMSLMRFGGRQDDPNKRSGDDLEGDDLDWSFRMVMDLDD